MFERVFPQSFVFFLKRTNMGAILSQVTYKHFSTLNRHFCLETSFYRCVVNCDDDGQIFVRFHRILCVGEYFCAAVIQENECEGEKHIVFWGKDAPWEALQRLKAVKVWTITVQKDKENRKNVCVWISQSLPRTCPSHIHPEIKEGNCYFLHRGKEW